MWLPLLFRGSQDQCSRHSLLNSSSRSLLFSTRSEVLLILCLTSSQPPPLGLLHGPAAGAVLWGGDSCLALSWDLAGCKPCPQPSSGSVSQAPPLLPFGFPGVCSSLVFCLIACLFRFSATACVMSMSLKFCFLNILFAVFLILSKERFSLASVLNKNLSFL